MTYPHWSVTHGRSAKRDRTYISWEQMRQRAKTGSAINAKNYKERGIDVCPEWDDFLTFVRDMGERPEGKSLDRIDNNKGYFKDNCRWATLKEQNRNRRNTVFATIDGVTKPLAEWCDVYSQDLHTALGRVRIGWDILRALTTPKRNKTNRYFPRREQEIEDYQK